MLADRLLGFLTARVRDRATAEDLLEATFLELLQRGRTIRGGPAAIKVWLFRAAHYNAIDHTRKLRRRAEELHEHPVAYDAEDPDLGPEERAVASDTARRVRRAMDSLSQDQRIVLLLRYVGGLSAPEVAAVLGKSDGAVRSLQHRGERALARVLDARHASPARSRAPRSSQDEGGAGTVGP